MSRFQRIHGGVASAMSAAALMLASGSAQVVGQPADANALLTEAFASGPAALARWEFSGDPKAKLTFEPLSGERPGGAVYIDYREHAAWRFMSRQTIPLRAAEQYTLRARVRRNLGYGLTRLVAETAGPAPVQTLAELEVINRNNVTHELTVVFRVPADTDARLGFDARGYAELWIESIHLQRNDPQISSYSTGMLLPARSPTTQARYRTGAFLEAEDIVATPQAVALADTDGDGHWAVCRLDPAANPWLFSDDTVLKSDSASAEEGGGLAPLKLEATGLLPGPYEVILSDPQRDAAVSLDGETWRRVPGGAEVNLGLVDVTGRLSVWVAHRFRTAGNPGPIYVDYLRLMPVYDATRGLEAPRPPPPALTPAGRQTTPLRLFQSRGLPRRQEWVTAGLPFARGAFRPGDGLRIASVARLVVQPLVHWPDGSVKWLRLQFLADSGATDTEIPVEYGRDVPPAVVLPPPVVPGAAPTFRRGALEVTIRDGTWTQVALAGQVLLAQPPTVRLRTSTGLDCSRLCVEAITLAQGDGQPAAWLRGHLADAAGRRAPFAFEAVLTETAPQTLGLRFSVLNEADERYAPEQGCGPATPLSECVLVLDGIQVTPAAVQWPTVLVPFDGRPQTLVQGGTGACVAEFAGQWRLAVGDSTVASGVRTDGWLDLRGDGVGLAVGVREFVERCPQRLSVRPGERGLAVEIAVWPADADRILRFAQGTRLTTELALVRHDGNLPPADREARLAAVLDPLTAALSPAYYCQTGAFGPVSATPDPRFAAFEASAAVSLQTLRAEHRRYGAVDWGDTFDRCGYVRTETKLWTNMEWNYVATLVVEFVRRGDPEAWRAALLAARHFVDQDVAHCSATPAWQGGSYVHTGDTREGHQVDRPDFAHAGWPEGLLWVYYLAGDERLRDTAVGLADYVVRNMPPAGPYQAQPPFSMWNCDRQAGNPILTLATVGELTRDPAHLRTLDRLVDFALRVQDPKLGCWSVPCYEEPARHYPSPTWGAVLPRGLYLYWQMTGDARVAQAFRRLGDFHLARHAPETRHYLKPGSYYRTQFYFVSEACAFAALFAADPTPLIDQGLAALTAAFPTTPPKVMDARGAPGALSGGSSLAGAAAGVGRAQPPGAAAQ